MILVTPTSKYHYVISSSPHTKSVLIIYLLFHTQEAHIPIVSIESKSLENKNESTQSSDIYPTHLNPDILSF